MTGDDQNDRAKPLRLEAADGDARTLEPDGAPSCAWGVWFEHSTFDGWHVQGEKSSARVSVRQNGIEQTVDVNGERHISIKDGATIVVDHFGPADPKRIEGSTVPASIADGIEAFGEGESIGPKWPETPEGPEPEGPVPRPIRVRSESGEARIVEPSDGPADIGAGAMLKWNGGPGGGWYLDLYDCDASVTVEAGDVRGDVDVPPSGEEVFRLDEPTAIAIEGEQGTEQLLLEPMALGEASGAYSVGSHDGGAECRLDTLEAVDRHIANEAGLPHTHLPVRTPDEEWADDDPCNRLRDGGGEPDLVIVRQESDQVVAELPEAAEPGAEVRLGRLRLRRTEGGWTAEATGGDAAWSIAREVGNFRGRLTKIEAEPIPLQDGDTLHAPGDHAPDYTVVAADRAYRADRDGAMMVQAEGVAYALAPGLVHLRIEGVAFTYDGCAGEWVVRLEDSIIMGTPGGGTLCEGACVLEGGEAVRTPEGGRLEVEDRPATPPSAGAAALWGAVEPAAAPFELGDIGQVRGTSKAGPIFHRADVAAGRPMIDLLGRLPVDHGPGGWHIDLEPIEAVDGLARCPVTDCEWSVEPGGRREASIAFEVPPIDGGDGRCSGRVTVDLADAIFDAIGSGERNEPDAQSIARETNGAGDMDPILTLIDTEGDPLYEPPEHGTAEGVPGLAVFVDSEGAGTCVEGASTGPPWAIAEERAQGRVDLLANNGDQPSRPSGVRAGDLWLRLDADPPKPYRVAGAGGVTFDVEAPRFPILGIRDANGELVAVACPETAPLKIEGVVFDWGPTPDVDREESWSAVPRASRRRFSLYGHTWPGEGDEPTVDKVPISHSTTLTVEGGEQFRVRVADADELRPDPDAHQGAPAKGDMAPPSTEAPSDLDGSPMQIERSGNIAGDLIGPLSELADAVETIRAELGGAEDTPEEMARFRTAIERWLAGGDITRGELRAFLRQIDLDDDRVHDLVGRTRGAGGTPLHAHTPGRAPDDGDPASPLTVARVLNCDAFWRAVYRTARERGWLDDDSPRSDDRNED